jgi:hypothetical protein
LKKAVLFLKKKKAGRPRKKDFLNLGLGRYQQHVMPAQAPRGAPRLPDFLPSHALNQT